MEEKTLEKSTVQLMEAARRFLERRNYYVRAQKISPNHQGLVAQDPDEENTIVICSVVNTEQEDSWSRSLFESTLQSFVKEEIISPDSSVRFDELSINVIDSNRAIMRHHINCMGFENVDDLVLGCYTVDELRQLMCRCETMIKVKEMIEEVEDEDECEL